MSRQGNPRRIFVLLHNIRSLQNVGSVLRTSDVFQVEKVFFSGFTGTPPNEKISKASLGAENTVSWEYRSRPSSVIKALKLKIPGLKVVALENNLPSTKVKVLDVGKFSSKSPILLVVGEEVRGVNKKLLHMCDLALEIPQFGLKESLNVSVAFGIAAYVLRCG